MMYFVAGLILTFGMAGSANAIPTDEIDGLSIQFSGIVDFGWVWIANEDHFTWELASSGAPVPEPATMLLLGTGLATLFGSAWRKNKRLEESRCSSFLFSYYDLEAGLERIKNEYHSPFIEFPENHRLKYIWKASLNSMLPGWSAGSRDGEGGRTRTISNITKY